MVALATAFVRLRPQPDKAEFTKTGRQMGEEAGTAAGKSYGDAFTRDSQGRLRDARGKFVKDSDAAGKQAGSKSGKTFAQSFNDGSKKLVNGLKSNLKLAAGVFVPLGLAGAVAEIGKIGIAYQDNLNIFKVVSKATSAQMDTVAEKARQLGSDVSLPGVSAAGAADAMTELAKAGFTVQQSMDAARATLQLSRIANLDEGTSAGIAAAAVNAFGINAKDTGKVVDELAAAANSSSVEISEASDSFKQASSTFSGFQGPAVGSMEAITELNTAIAVLGNNGIKGSDAGTSLRQMLLQLTGPSNQAKDIMKQLAINASGANTSLADQTAVLHGSNSERNAAISAELKHNKSLKNVGDIAFDSTGKMRSLRDILKLTAAGTKNMTAEEKDYALTQIFGADASRSVIALLKGGIGVYDKQRKAVLQQGAAAEVAQAKNAGLGGAIDNVRSQIENAAISVFNSVKGPLTNGLNAIASVLPGLFAGIAQFAGFVHDNIGVIRDWALAIGAVTLALKLNSLMLSIQAAGGVLKYIQSGKLIVSLTKSWAAAQELLNASLFANPIGIVIIAITALVAGFVLAYKHSQTFRDIVNATWGAIRAAIGATVDWIVHVAWPAIVTAWQAIAAAGLWLWHTVIEPVWHGIQAVIGVVVAVVKVYIALMVAEFHVVAAVVTWLWHTIFQPAFAAIAKAAQIWWLAVQIVFKLFQIAVSKTVVPVINGLRVLATAVFGAFKAAVQGWWNLAKAIFGLFVKYIVGPFIASLIGWRNLFVGIFNFVSSAVANWYNAHIKKYVDAARLLWAAFGTALSDTWNKKIKPLFAAFVGYFKNNVVNGFKNAVSLIKSAWDGIKAAAKAPVSFVVNHVINPFIGGLNKAASIVGIKDRVEPIKGFRQGGQVGRSTGGKISGAGGISDNRQAVIPGVGAVQLQGGEYIVNRHATAAVLPLLQWLNAGMKGGPRNVARYIGRPMADMPGDGSEGFAFKGGGLVGWAENVWDAVTHPLDTIRKPFDAALRNIPGVGMIKDFLVGSAERLAGGAVDWVKKIAGGGGKVGDAVRFLHQQDGKPYGWANAGPDSYDCSGIVSAVYNILHGRNPYGHTFSTESASSFFPKPGQAGQMAAAWSHPGQSPASNSVGHMMGRVGNMNFESTGSRGVHLGKTTRSLSDFAQIGHYLGGGLFGKPVQLFDKGGYWPTGTLGANLSGRTEFVSPGGAGGGEVHIHLHNNGVIGSEEEMDRWLSGGINRLDRSGKLPKALRGRS